MLNVLLRDFFFYFCCCSLLLIIKCTRTFFSQNNNNNERLQYRISRSQKIFFYIHPITPIGDSIFEYKAFFPYIHSPPLTLYIYFFSLKRPLTLNPHNRHSEKKVHNLQFNFASEPETSVAQEHKSIIIIIVFFSRINTLFG